MDQLPSIEQTNPPLSKKGRYLLLISIIFGFLLYVVASFFLINKFFVVKKTEKKTSSEKPSLITQSNKYRVSLRGKEIFETMPQWSFLEGSSSAQFSNDNLETFQSSRSNKLYAFKTNSDFEVKFGIKIINRKESKSRERLGSFQITSGVPLKENEKQPETISLLITSRDDRFSGFLYYDFPGQNPKAKPEKDPEFIKDAPLPTNGNFRIRFENASNDLPETIIVYDDNTSRELGRVQSPKSFFPGSFYFKAYLMYQAEMNINHLEILVPEIAKDVEIINLNQK